MKKGKIFTCEKSALVLIFVFSVIITSCNEFENNWDRAHYGSVTIVNALSYDIYSIQIWKYSDGSGAKIVDTNALLSGESRTYRKDAALDIELNYSDFRRSNNRRLVTINGYTKWIYISEGKNVELVVNSSGLTLTNPIYEVYP